MNQPQPYPPDYLDLVKLLPTVWQQLDNAVRDRRSPGHTPTAATIGNDGSPRLRTVVLRGCDPVHRILHFHTDQRAEKWRELQADPRLSMHFYLPEPKLQFRFRGQAVLEHQSSMTETKWRSMSRSSRACYRVIKGPGTPIDNPVQDLVAAQSSDHGYENLAIVKLHIESLDWLYLSSLGHLRAQFQWCADGTLNSHWVGP